MQRNLVNKIFIYGLIVILFYASFSQNLHATDIGYKSIKQKDYQDIYMMIKKKKKR